MGQLIQELKRRNVIRVAIAYAVSAWLLIQVADALFPMLRLPEWAATFVAVLLLIGFPIALIFAWAFELTPEGIKLEKHVVRDDSVTHVTGRKLDFVIIAMLAVALGYFGYDKFILNPDRNAAEIEAAVQNARDETASAVEPHDSAKTIAVLPFVNMSDDPGNEYFSDGISEEILNLLTKVPELRVTSRSSAFSFKGQNLDVPTMAAKLNVAHVLEGSVRKSGKQLRITAQLIEVVTDTQLWSESYDRELEDIFAIQDEIANRVVSELKLTLLAKRESSTHVTSPEAYALFLQGKYLLNHVGSAEDFKKSDSYLRESLVLDPGYAPAWERLAYAQITQVTVGYLEFGAGYQLAKEFTNKALELDPELAGAHANLGYITMMFDRDMAAAVEHLQRALDLSPFDAFVLSRCSVFAETIGRFERGIELSERTLAIDPLNSTTYANVATIYAYTGQFDKAEARFRKSAELTPERQYMWPWFAKMYLLQGRPDQALALTDKITSEPRKLWILSMAYHDLGRATESDEALHRLKEVYSNEAASYIAEIHAWRGEVDEAFYWLERAIEERQYMWGSLVFDPAFKKLHGHPRWPAIRAALGRSEEQIKRIQY